MTGRLDWSTIEATFDLGGYSVDAALTDGAAFLAILGLTLLQNEYLWQDYVDFDDVETAIDDAIDQIMNGSLAGGDMIKIAEVVSVEDIASLKIDNFDVGIFRTYKLIIQGMKSDYDTVYVDHLLIQLNEDDATEHYDDLVLWENKTQYVRYEHLTTKAGFHMEYAISTTKSEVAALSMMEMTLFDPQGDDFKHVLASGMVGGTNSGALTFTRLQGTYNSEDTITSIEIFPVLGTEFKVDPDSSIAPSELRMTLYGLKQVGLS